MKFTETPISGAFAIELEPISDERGHFARSFDREAFAAHSLDPVVAQCNVSFNNRAGTLRGMHFQREPHGEAKLVRCTRGAIYDVIIDLREDSPTFCQWYAIELTADNNQMLYIPVGVAHGFQTLADNSEVFYQMAAAYVPSHADGVRWDDPAFGIEWPDANNRVISDRDRSYPDFER